jgi:hypothetical protein
MLVYLTEIVVGRMGVPVLLPMCNIGLQRYQLMGLGQSLIARNAHTNIAIRIDVALIGDEVNALATHVAVVLWISLPLYKHVMTIWTDLFGTGKSTTVMAKGYMLLFS